MTFNDFEVCMYQGGQVSASLVVKATSYAHARLLAQPTATALGMRLKRPDGSHGLVILLRDQPVAGNA